MTRQRSWLVVCDITSRLPHLTLPCCVCAAQVLKDKEEAERINDAWAAANTEAAPAPGTAGWMESFSAATPAGTDAPAKAATAAAAAAADGAKDGPVGDENAAAAVPAASTPASRANGSDKAAAAWSSSVLASADGW